MLSWVKCFYFFFFLDTEWWTLLFVIQYNFLFLFQPCSVKHSLLQKNIIDTMTKIFCQHGAIRISTPLLMPKNEIHSARTPTFMDQNGQLVCLANNLKVIDFFKKKKNIFVGSGDKIEIYILTDIFFLNFILRFWVFAWDNVTCYIFYFSYPGSFNPICKTKEYT